MKVVETIPYILIMIELKHMYVFGAGEERLDLNPSLNLNGHVRSDADGKEVMR